MMNRFKLTRGGRECVERMGEARHDNHLTADDTKIHQLHSFVFTETKNTYYYVIIHILSCYINNNNNTYLSLIIHKQPKLLVYPFL